jgi:hypothetical protein
MAFWKNITTGKDNQTHDIVRSAMTAVIIVLVIVMMAGTTVYIIGYWKSLANPTVKMFDIQTFFTAVSVYAVAIGSFLAGGAAAILLKKSTEPDGTVNEEEKITKGEGT